MNKNITLSINFVEKILVLWFLFMVNAHFWFGTTEILLDPSTYVMWSFWIYLVGSIIGLLLIPISIIVIILIILALYDLYIGFNI